MRGRTATRRDPREVRHRWRLRPWPPARLASVALVILVALAGQAFAFDPVVGTELLLADARGNTLVGYGRVAEDGLRLQLSDTTRELRVVVIGPDGRAESYRGLMVDGRLTILDGDRAPLDVADALARERRTLTLALEGEPEVVVPPSTGPVAATGGEDGSDGAQAGSANGDADAGGEPAAGAGGDAAANEPPGRSGEAPGRSGDAPGRSGDAPGRSGDAPGRSGDAPGRSGDAPGRSGDAPGGGGAPEGGDDGASSGGGSLLGILGAGEADGDLVDLVDLADGWP